MTIENKNFTTVDIMIACHNRAKDIEKLINHFYKIKCPTNIKFFIRIVDDCSSDNSVAIIKSLQKKYSTLYLIENKENKGLFYNRYLLLNESNADYIFFIDDDDDVSDNLFSEFAKHLNCDLIRTIRKFINGNDSYVKFKNEDLNLTQPSEMFTKINLHYCTGIFISKHVYKQILNLLDELKIDNLYLNMREDIFYFYLMVNFARNFVFISSYYDYFITTNGLSLAVKKNILYNDSLMIWKLLIKAVEILKTKKLYNVSVSYTQFNLWYLMWVESNKNHLQLFYDLFKKIDLQPLRQISFKNKVKCNLLKCSLTYLLLSYFVRPFLKVK